MEVGEGDRDGVGGVSDSVGTWVGVSVWVEEGLALSDVDAVWEKESVLVNEREDVPLKERVGVKLPVEDPEPVGVLVHTERLRVGVPVRLIDHLGVCDRGVTVGGERVGVGLVLGVWLATAEGLPVLVTEQDTLFGAVWLRDSVGGVGVEVGDRQGLRVEVEERVAVGLGVGLFRLPLKEQLAVGGVHDVVGEGVR